MQIWTFTSMAQLFCQALRFHGIPPNKLVKFRGTPQQVSDLTLTEWLDEFKEAVSGYELTEKQKAKALIDHLAGPPREVLGLFKNNSVDFWPFWLSLVSLAMRGVDLSLNMWICLSWNTYRSGRTRGALSK